MSTLRLVVVSGLCLGLSVSVAPAQQTPPATPAASAQPGGRKPVKTQDDLPRHTYHIDGKASEFVLSDAPFHEFVGKVKTDAESDLKLYDIQDRTTLQGYYALLQQIAMYEGRLDDAAAYVDRIRELEAKDSKRLMTGQVLLSMISAAKTAGGLKPDDAKFLAAFKTELDKRIRALPWETVKEDVNSAKGRAEIITRDLVLGGLSGALDPVVEANKGEVSGELVRNLVGIRVMLD